MNQNTQPTDLDLQFGLLQFLYTFNEKTPASFSPLLVLRDAVNVDSEHAQRLLADLCDNGLAEQESNATRYRITATGVEHCKSIMARLHETK